jgi:hypothetical protein
MLYRDITISIRDVSAVAHDLKANPHFGRSCLKFIILSRLSDDKAPIAVEAFGTFYDDLIVLLTILGENARLEAFTWISGAGSCRLPVPVPSGVWYSLSKSAGSLKSLYLIIGDGQESWVSHWLRSSCLTSFPSF